MSQIAIDFDALARNSDPETSHEAAARVAEFAHGHYALILGSLTQHGGQTIHELAYHTGLDHVQVARRTADLHKADRIERTGATRLGPNKRRCCVWSVMR